MEQGDEEALLPADHNQRRRSTRHYEQMDSWKRLARIGIIKFLMTVFFGASLCLCLKAWEGFHRSIPLSKHDIRIFNALTIGISICLGLNLLTSLKRYAVFLRWAILTMFWVPVEIFDLILGIDELTNVARLFVLSIPILSRHRWLRGTSRPWKDAQPYTKLKFATVCSVWLLINIGSQVLVASLSLFWPTEAYTCPLTKYGSVSVADLTKWSIEETRERNFTSYEAAWRYGMEAQAWSNVSITEPPPDLSQLPGTPIYRGDGFYEYRFFYRNPDRLYSDYLQSDRGIKAEASCTKYNVVNVTDLPRKEKADPSGFNVEVNLPGQETTTNITIPEYGYGMLVYIGSKTYDCGPRCSQVTVFQSEPDSGDLKTAIPDSSLWLCKNEVSEIYQLSNGTSHSGKEEKDERIVGTDGFARIAAGAIAWTGISENNWYDRQWRLYTQRTPFSPPYIPETSEVEEFLERFSIGAIASFDDHGIRYNVTINNETCDEDSQKINVNWHYVLSILGAICGIQLAALCYLLARANKSIVRDSSYFSVAMLLQPVLKVIQLPGRMAMTGLELKDHALLRDRNIRYDFKELPDKTRQVTVWFEDEWKGHMRKKWPSGDYGG